MKYAVSVAALIILSVLPSMAATLDDYYGRVKRAAVIAGELHASGRSDAVSLSELRELVPPKEKVEWSGGSIETDNRWLAGEIESFVSDADAKSRATRMGGIFERLNAVAEKIADLKRAEALGTSKDENKQKIGEILRRPEYQKPAPPEESLFQKWYRALMEWLKKALPNAPETPEPSAPGFGSLRLVLLILIFGAVIGLVGFLIFKFAPALFERFGRGQKKKKSDRIILGERIAAGETSEGLFDDAERLAREGRLREAIRKGYIAALCELSDRKIVRLARHKTNRDYLRDVRKTRSAIVEDMSGLTGTYERNWYGLRASDAADWEDFRERYRSVIRAV